MKWILNVGLVDEGMYGSLRQSVKCVPCLGVGRLSDLVDSF